MNPKLLLYIIIWFFPLGCVSNASYKTGRVEKRYTKFGIDLPGDDWKPGRFRGADLFFEHKSHRATIFINSQCKDVSDSPLEALTAQLLVGLTNIEIAEQQSMALGERQGLVSNINAKIDGIERFFRVLVLRKNRCVYDAVL